ncbi:MAG: hypothetical protein ACTSRH_09045 [Promethearchaeota archaeon]
MKINSKILYLTEKQINILENFFKKIDFPIKNISNEFDIEKVSLDISNQYEKTISPGQVEAIILRLMGKQLSSKERTQLYNLRKKIRRYERFLNKFKEWGKKYDYVFKFLILGLTDEQSNYLSNIFVEPNIPTDKDILGVQFFTELIENIDKIFIKLQIWDISGDERFEVLRLKYYKGAHSAILIYNKEDPNSINIIKKYYEELIKATNLKTKFIFKRKIIKEVQMPLTIIFIGNKSEISAENMTFIKENITNNCFEIKDIKDNHFSEIIKIITSQIIIMINK